MDPIILTFRILTLLGFLALLGVILYAVAVWVMGWFRNSRSPKITVPAMVAAKRIRTIHLGSRGRGASTETVFYVRFEPENSGSMELLVSNGQFERLTEGDRGVLTFQGTRFLDFQKTF